MKPLTFSGVVAGNPDSLQIQIVTARCFRSHSIFQVFLIQALIQALTVLTPVAWLALWERTDPLSKKNMFQLRRCDRLHEREGKYEKKAWTSMAENTHTRV